MWNIEPLEFATVDPGKGDINIYFKTITSEHVMGYAHYPEEGKVFINDKLKPNQGVQGGCSMMRDGVANRGCRVGGTVVAIGLSVRKSLGLGVH
ncbi:hypothetical protein CDAR_613071 [Caerostris darwini]|uniref:Uncharacterized protein n=1 Tax=Caerostris darwini TaxID=1538125 RepID=A0AAV4PK04_9ARAC|nr:hypothetical protein CDAR_613071 [Caerostris darwini]